MIPIESLEAGEKEKIEGLESKSDMVMGLRAQLAAFYKENKAYLPQLVNENADKWGDDVNPDRKRSGWKRLTLSDLHALMTEGTDVLTMLDFSPIEKATAKLEGKAKMLAAHARQAKVKAAVTRALDTYEQVLLAGGDFTKKNKEPSEKELREYYRMRFQEKAIAMQDLANLEREVEEAEMTIEYLKNDPEVAGDPDTFAALEEEYTKKHDAYYKLIHESPEAYFATYGAKLEEWSKTLKDGGRIVEVPYVKAKIAFAHSYFDRGRPVFIHGELGSGKTELALHICRRELSKPHLDRWMRQNPPPEDEKSKEYADWLARYNEERNPLFVSGHKNLEAEQMTATRGIERKEPLSPEQLADIVRTRWAAYRESRTAELQGQEGGETLAKQIDDERGGFERAMHEVYKNPIQTRTILGPLLRAMREGRPVIIDEMNAIPHHALIAINDLLMRRPGETVTPPFADSQPFVVAEGFRVIATGNYKPEDGKKYVGRQQIDAALLSRFGIMSYDYLPNERELEAPGLSPEDSRKHREQNQMYWMFLSHIYAKGKNGQLRLPEGSLEKLRNLAYVGRLLQDVFSDREVGDAMYATVSNAKVKPHAVLAENVLSIRHVLPVLDAWAAEGFTRPIEDYLFLYYISRSDARPAEKVYLYDKMKVVGSLFPNAEGWPDGVDQMEILNFPIEERFFGQDKTTGKRKPRTVATPALVTYSKKAIIEEMFGPVPKRKTIRSTGLERMRKVNDVEEPDDVAAEKEAELVRMLAELKKNADDINVLDEDKKFQV